MTGERDAFGVDPASDHVQGPSDKYLCSIYPEVDAFAVHVRNELWANRHKGDQVVWRQSSARELWAEVGWHSAKLALAIAQNNTDLIREHAADVAAMAMMVADVSGAL